MTQSTDIGVVPEFDVADRMRKALRTGNVGVQEMAEYLGVARNTVGNWINGRIEPSTQTLRLWALRTGVPFKWLETGKTPTGNDPDGGDGTNGLRIKSPKLFQLSYRGTDDFSNVHDLFPRRAAA